MVVDFLLREGTLGGGEDRPNGGEKQYKRDYDTQERMMMFFEVVVHSDRGEPTRRVARHDAKDAMGYWNYPFILNAS